MLHPVLHLLATRPQWLADHAQAYAELATAELDDTAMRTRRALLLATATVAALGVAATLAGVALMLWAITPALTPQAQGLLLATPAPPLLLALGCLLAQRRTQRAAWFAALRGQLRADLALLREAGET